MGGGLFVLRRERPQRNRKEIRRVKGEESGDDGGRDDVTAEVRDRRKPPGAYVIVMQPGQAPRADA